jgi:hypothetical protein
MSPPPACPFSALGIARLATVELRARSVPDAEPGKWR